MSDTEPQYSGRHYLVLGLALLTAGGLAWRGLDLTLERRDFLQTQGDARYLRVVDIPAHRGIIRDRNGETLAMSTPVESVWAKPADLAAERSRLPQLALALELPEAQLQRTVTHQMGRDFVYLRRHVPPEVADRVRALKLSGVGLQREYRRYYPTGEVSAHVVGFTNVDDQGQEGIELAYDDWLKGRDGAKRVIRDRLGQLVEDVESIHAPEPGKDLYLSLDRRIQYLAYRELKAGVKRNRARAGSLVVLDARSGEVLAMVNQPAYNPNNTADRVSRRFRNRAVTDVFEPGSTIKPFTVMAGLASGLFGDHTLIDTAPGTIKVGRYTVHDTHNYGTVDLSMLIKKSSNVGASKIALTIPPETLWGVLDAVGLGMDTGSGFPGEASGTLSDFVRWGEVQRATLSFGYGLSVTPLQLARAYGVLAADGVLHPVSFIRLDKSPEGESVLDSGDARRVRRMLEGVLETGGTGTRGRVAGYRVGAKTGTVRKSGVGGYTDDRYFSVFAGMAPASAPRVVIVVVVDEPRGKDYYGGLVAAPIFSRVMAGSLRILGVEPDNWDGARLHLAHRLARNGGDAGTKDVWQ